MHVNQSAAESSWSEKLSRLSPERRRKILDRAARLIADLDANPSEQEMSVRQLQAALEIDPNLVLDVLSSVRTNELSSADIEKLKQQAMQAQCDFDGLVNATQTLRTSLTEIGVMAMKDRLPETVEQWKEAVGKLVVTEAQQLAAQKDYLLEQQRELEKRRTDILTEIEEAHKLLQADSPLLTKLSLGMFSPLRGRITSATGAISSLSFDYNQIEAPRVGTLTRGEGVFTRLWIPKYKNGKSLGIECELYSAPEDLRLAPQVNSLQTYLNTIESVASLRGWHGHDGGKFANDWEVVGFLNKTVKQFEKINGRADIGTWFRPDGIGKWFVPFGEHVDGKSEDKNGNRTKICDENHYDLKDTGDFSGTFTTTTGSVNAHWYWSSSEYRGVSVYVWNVDFTDGDGGWGHEVSRRLSCRPVRVGRIRHLTI